MEFKGPFQASPQTSHSSCYIALFYEKCKQTHSHIIPYVRTHIIHVHTGERSDTTNEWQLSNSLRLNAVWDKRNHHHIC